MTPDRLREILAMTPLSLRQLAIWLRVQDREVRRWASGQNPIPGDASIWLEKLAHFLKNAPPPRQRKAMRTDERYPATVQPGGENGR